MKYETGVVDGLESWVSAGERLRDIDPDCFGQLLALARAYVSNHERELEGLEIFHSRLAQIRPGSRKVAS